MIIKIQHPKERFASIVLIIGILIIYWQVSSHSFINLDDGQYVYENPYINEGLTWRALKWSLTAIYASNWHPLTWISHMTDISLFGLNAGLHHLINVLFHIFNSILLFYVFNRMTRLFWHSFFLSALFAFHPMHVESVAWLSERKDVLSTFFWVLTLWSYIRYVEVPGIKRYIVVIAFFIAGIMAKPMLVTLPFVLILLDFWPLNRFTNSSIFQRIRKSAFEKISLIIFAGVSSTITLIAQRSGGAVVPITESLLWGRVANSIVSYVNYLYKMIWPFDLAIPYPYPSSIPFIHVFLAVLCIVIITTGSIVLARTRPYLIIGWLWYLGTLLPVIGFIQIGHQAMADRYTYIPYIGIYIAVLWGMSDLWEKFQYRRVLYYSASTIVLLFFVYISWFQVKYWKNSTMLFSHAIKVTKNNFAAHLNLGVALAEKGKTEAAITHYREALKTYPKYAMAHYNLGLALDSMGKTDRAAWHYKEAIKLKPDYKKAFLNLGMNLAEKGQIEEALENYFKAIDIDPKYRLAYKNIGAAYKKQGRLNEAINIYFKALSVDPEFVSAYIQIGYLLENQGEIEKAIGYYLKALQLNPELEIVHFNLGVVFVKEKRYNDALYHYSEALRLNPDDAEAYNNLGTTLIRVGKINAAIKAFQSALAIKPDYTVARQNLNNTLKVAEKLSIKK